MKKVFDVADVRELATTKKEVDTKTVPFAARSLRVMVTIVAHCTFRSNAVTSATLT